MKKQLITKQLKILTVAVMSLSLNLVSLAATSTEFVDNEPLLRAQKINNEYTFPLALSLETSNFPEVFENKDFTELRLFYFLNANKVNPVMENHLLISDKKYRSSYAITKYDHNNVIKMINGRYNKVKTHRFEHREVWLYVQYSEVSKMMVVYMDSEKDGLIYDCKDKDNQIDRVGIYYPEGLVTYSMEDLAGELPLPNYRRGIKIDSREYRINLIRAMRRLHQEGESFQPFSNTSVKISCNRNDQDNVAMSTQLKNPTIINRKYENIMKMDRFAANMNEEERNWWSAPVGYSDFNRSDFFADIMNQGSKREWRDDSKIMVEGQDGLIENFSVGIDQ